MTKFLNNADVKGYVAQTAVTSSLLKTDSAGKLVAAVADTDYATPGALASADKMVTVGRNATGATLYKGTVVYISGSTGNRPNFVKAQANVEATSAGTFGVVFADIANNADGQVVTIGAIDSLDTRSNATNPFTDVTLADGDTIYLHPTIAGYVTNVKPSAPNHLVYVGKVVRTSPTNGTIVYRIQNGYELDELHNVAIATLANNQTIVWESATSLWKNKTIAAALGYTPADDSLVLKLTGGTLTGDLTLSGTNPRLYFTDTDNNPDYFISNTDGTFTVYDVTNSVGRFKIYSTGNAEFSNSLAATNIILGSGTINSIPSWMKVITTDATQSGLGAVYNNKAIYVYNNGSALKIDAYDYGVGAGLDIQVGGNGGKIILSNGQVRFSAYTSATSYSGTAAGYLAFDSSGNVITVAGVAATDNTKLPLTGGTVTGQTNFSAATGGSSGQNTVVGVQIQGLGAYASLELGIESNYVGVIRSYGNDIRYYAGHWRTVGTAATEDHSHYWYTSKSGSANWSTTKMQLDQDGNLSIPLGRLLMGTSGTSYISMGRFPNSVSNSGEAWLGRASDRSTGSMTVQLGGSSNASFFEVVDYAWTTVTLRVGMNDFSYKGNAVIHAGNYNSYSPTLTGGGASGTWVINVTGSSRSLLFSGDSAKQFSDSQWAGGGSYPGYAFTGGNSRFGFSSTSGVIDVYTDGNFYATDSSYLVWHQGNLTNLNQLTNGPGYITSGGTVAGLNTTFLGTDSTNISSGYSRVIRNENSSGGNPTYAPVLHLAASDTMWQIAGAHGGSTTLVWRSGYAGNWSTPWWNILHTGNLGSYALPLSGGTMTGTLNFANGDGALQSAASGGVSFYTNEINAGAQGGTGQLYLGWRRTTQINLGVNLSSSSTIYTSGIGSFGADSGSDTGIRINYNSSGYGRIRFFQDGNNHQTIHAFGSNGYSPSNGKINIDGQNGVNIGSWNDPDFVVNKGAQTYARGYRGIGNVAGTGEASYHPAGIYSTGNNWLYGNIMMNGYSISGANTISGSGLITGGTVRSNTNIYTDQNYGYGLVGVYTSTRYQGVFAMGDAYKLPADGTSTGSLYGIAWSHPNAGGITSNLNTHGMIVMENGNFLAAISGRIRTRDEIYSGGWMYSSGGNTGWYQDNQGQGIRAAGYNSYFGTIATYGTNSNGYGGYTIMNNYRVILMQNSSGDFGFYNNDDWAWQLFYNRSNNCWGIGTDNTYSGDGFRCVKYGSAQYGWTTWSDRRAKENISTITGALDKVLAMRGVNFNYIIDEEKNKRVGFIAQELIEVLPEAVRYAEEIDEYNVEYGQIVSVLAEAIKEQDVKMKLQEDKIALLQAQLQTLLN
jgi:hypothetical protein